MSKGDKEVTRNYFISYVYNYPNGNGGIENTSINCLPIKDIENIKALEEHIRTSLRAIKVSIIFFREMAH